jgi:hypothetical protein
MASTLSQANHYEVQHGHVTVTYTLDDLTGPNPHLTYDDHGTAHTFSGTQLVRTDTPVGTLLSVVVKPSIDADTTFFSLMLPNVNLAGESSCKIETFGVTTVRHTTIAGPSRGQLDDYTVSHPFKGSASVVLT